MLPIVVQGASRGIGAELTRQLLARGHTVFATARAPENSSLLVELAERYGDALRPVALDVQDEQTIARAAEYVREHTDKLALLANVAGLLHADGRGPERRIRELEPDWLAEVFAVNAFGPLLVAKHFASLLQHDARAVLLNVSARVGSIEDNRKGGWYGYRASKAAQNMFTKNLSIELPRRFPELIVMAYHPGTVETSLSEPFRGGVRTLFSVQRAAGSLLKLIDSADVGHNGGFFAWDGSRIPW